MIKKKDPYGTPGLTEENPRKEKFIKDQTWFEKAWLSHQIAEFIGLAGPALLSKQQKPSGKQLEKHGKSY